MGGVMLTTTKMSSRGQVVIPEIVRKQLDLQNGAQFAVVARNDVVILKIITKPKQESFEDIVARIRKSAKAAALTHHDLEDAIREVRKK